MDFVASLWLGAGLLGALLIIILGSLILHEIAHGLMALRLGDDTARDQGRLSLNPLRHLHPIGSLVFVLSLLILRVGIGWARPVPVDPGKLKDPKRDMAWIAIAGPLMNFALAFVAMMILTGLIAAGVTSLETALYATDGFSRALVNTTGLWGALIHVGNGTLGVEEALQAFFLSDFAFTLTDADWAGLLPMLLLMVNLGFGVFNLIPFPPLDGSRILFAFLPYRWGFHYYQLQRFAIPVVVIAVLWIRISAGGF